MGKLDSDILHLIALDIFRSPRNDSIPSLLEFSSVSRSARNACLPFIFREVKWPHPRKQNPHHGLDFFPEPIWMYIRHLRFAWPNEWTNLGRPKWGYIEDEYYMPDHREMERLAAVIPKLLRLSSFHVTCPFVPPECVLTSLALCPKLSSLTVYDTRLGRHFRSYSHSKATISGDALPTLRSPLPLKHISIMSVGQVILLGDSGEGPDRPQYHDVSYHIREWKRRYFRKRPPQGDDISREIFATQSKTLAEHERNRTGLFTGQHSTTLTHLEVSGTLCSFASLAAHDWPQLQTFAIMGAVPVIRDDIKEYPWDFTLSLPSSNFMDVLWRMPKLRDLRLLFSTTELRVRILTYGDPRGLPPAVQSLTSLAVSDMCDIIDIEKHFHSLERLAILSSSNWPQIPVAQRSSQLVGTDTLGWDLGRRLTHLRLMIEDELRPAVCQDIADRCPSLTSLEIETVGYREINSIYGLHDYVDALLSLSTLRFLRLGIPFPEREPDDEEQSVRSARKPCARLFAERILSLEAVGFEYRCNWAATFRYHDAWLDYRIIRKGGVDGDVDAVDLVEMASAWYAFPEVWELTSGRPVHR